MPELLLPQLFDRFRNAKDPQEALQLGDSLLVFLYTMQTEQLPAEVSAIIGPLTSEIETVVSHLGESPERVKAACEALQQSPDVTDLGSIRKSIGDALRERLDVDPEEVRRYEEERFKALPFKGGPGSGNFGHAGRPGEVGGSAPDGSPTVPNWQDPGGYEHTGITWKQETDPKTGRPIPIKVATTLEAVALIQKGMVVEVPDARSAYTVISKLSDMAREAKAAGKEAKDYDLCQISVAGTNLFCAESLRTKEYPEGVPRLEMPQLGGKPVPGSEADKLPRNPWDKTEVDGSQHFISFLQGLGIRTTAEQVPAAQLRASQRELIGSKVSSIMMDKTFKPNVNPIFISRDNYVVDGHHRWAATVGRETEGGTVGRTPMNVYRINAPISEVLHLANNWATKFGIQQSAGVVRQAAATGLTKP